MKTIKIRITNVNTDKLTCRLETDWLPEIMDNVPISRLLAYRIKKARDNKNKQQLEGVLFKSDVKERMFSYNPLQIVKIIDKDTKHRINYEVRLVSEKKSLWEIFIDRFGNKSKREVFQEYRYREFNRVRIEELTIIK